MITYSPSNLMGAGEIYQVFIDRYFSCVWSLTAGSLVFFLWNTVQLTSLDIE